MTPQQLNKPIHFLIEFEITTHIQSHCCFKTKCKTYVHFQSTVGGH